MPALRPVDSLDGYCCPNCRGSIRGEDAKSYVCEKCNITYSFEWIILNFLGDDAHLFPDRADVSKAAWIVEHYPRFAAVLPEIRAAQAKPPAQRRADYERLAASGLGTAELLESVVSSTPFVQLMNDLSLYFGAHTQPSETVGFLHASIALGPDSRVLDVGCSNGGKLRELAGGSAQLHGLDVSLISLAVGAAAWGRTGLANPPRWCCGSALSLPFPDESFSHVTSFVVLGLLPIRAAVAEIRRVLAPSGQLLFTIEGPGFARMVRDNTPSTWGRLNLWRWTLGRKLFQWGIDWQGHRVLGRSLAGLTQYTPEMLRRVLEKGGFAVDQCKVLRTYKGEPSLLAVEAHKIAG